MTDRVITLVVCLEKEYRDDDVEVIADAIRLLRGVREVELGPALRVEDYYARETAKHELRRELLEVLAPDIARRAPAKEW